eukprot:6467325-Amphidinium_carterae.1
MSITAFEPSALVMIVLAPALHVRAKLPCSLPFHYDALQDQAPKPQKRLGVRIVGTEALSQARECSRQSTRWTMRGR